MKKLLLITAFCCFFSVNAQFRLLKDLRTGTASSFVGKMYEFNGRLFFSAITPSAIPTAYRYICATDGTELGTVNITVDYTVYSQNLAHNVDQDVVFYGFNSDLFFDIKNLSNNEISLAKLSGSSNMSSTEYSITNAVFSYSGRFTQPFLMNNNIIFSPLGAGGSKGLEPHLFDISTPANSSVLKDIYPGGTGSNPQEFTWYNNAYFFSANNGASNGREIWKTDGTPTGTVLYLDIVPGINSSNPSQLTVVGSNLVFAAENTTVGRELFKTNGSGSLGLIRNIHPTGDSNPSNLTNIGGALYFSADNDTNGIELWKSDGNTSLGTLLIKDINPSGDSNPSKFFQFGTEVYFTADDGTNGIELWKTDGTSGGTTLVKNINPTGSSNPDYFTEYNGKLYFVADNGTNGKELWVTDGTTVGTIMLELNPVGDATVTNLIVFNNELYMAADAGDGIGQELWAYQDPTLSINDNQLNGKQVSMYPNPTNNHFQIETTETLNKVEIYSLQGQLVKSFVPQNQYDVSDLSSGMYFVNIHANGNSVSKRLIKE